MTKFVALNISVSEDGYMAGPKQSQDAPLGINGPSLHKWAFVTRGFKQWHGESGGTTGLDNDYIERGFTNIGATIMGRNMFGPVRGEWPDENWKGWWGPEPGYRHPVFVLTHYARPTLDMGNGTVFHFITGGIEQAYAMAGDAAKGLDVRIGGGAQAIQQFMIASLLDELHFARIPVKLRAGEKLFSNPASQLRNYAQLPDVISESLVHVRYVKI
jgi:dihydrofolate reductase